MEAQAEPEQTETFDSDDDSEYDPVPDDDSEYDPVPDDDSEYDPDDYEDDDDGDEDDEIDENDEISFLRQHFFAIFIALIATIGVHFYTQSTFTTAGSTTSIFPRFLFRPFGNFVDKHNHLKGFSRTANISFCEQQLQAAATKRLHSMDFFLPRDNFGSIQELYVADQTEDDTYTETDVIKKEYDVILKDNMEFQCLFDQHHNTDNDRKLKGTTYFYEDPTLEEIYPELANEKSSSSSSTAVISSEERQRKLQQPPLTFTGFAAKFVNLDTNPVLLYWDGKGGHENSRKLVGEIPPMESIGTATMPGHSFHITPIYDPSTVLKYWVLTPDAALVFYEPKNVAEMKEALQVKDSKAYAMYQRQMMNKAFSRDYTVVSGRTWLGHFPRPFPMHYMHEASYIGQEHHVSDMTLKVASVTPRVFTIENFLTPEECQELIRLGLDQGLAQSTLHSSPLTKQNRDTSTRSSSNTWLSRDTSSLTKKIYEKTAELTKIDPDLFQKFHETSAQHHSIAESLQVVRYKKGEEYTPHHDFVSPSINSRHQPSRFATLLIYLNDVTEGGETRFPRAVNNYSAEGLQISPKVGTAVLFYNSLEDGNFDDLSQHGGNKVLAGNKWLANLWIWDPVIG